MIRDRDKYSDDEYEENLATLALAQGKLREHIRWTLLAKEAPEPAERVE